MIGEIGQQAVQIAVTNASLEAQKKIEQATKDEAQAKAQSTQASDEAAQLRANGQIAEADAKQVQAKEAEKSATLAGLTAKAERKKFDAEWGITSNFQIAARAASAALQGLAGGNVGQAVSGAAAPYLAKVIKDMTYDPISEQTNLTANVMAHALLGAVVAQTSGGNAAAGAVGAGSAPLVGRMVSSLISKEVYQEDDPSKLTEEQKQIVSALTTLAGTMAGAAVGGDSAAALTGGQAAKNEVENNTLVNAKQRSIIQRIANGDAAYEHRLTAAACARLKCSAQFLSGTKEYKFYQSLEAEGAKYTSEQSQLAKYSKQELVATAGYGGSVHFETVSDPFKQDVAADGAALQHANTVRYLQQQYHVSASAAEAFISTVKIAGDVANTVLTVAQVSRLQAIERSVGAKGVVDRNAQASLSVNKVTAPIDFDGHVLSAEIKPNGNVVGGHSIATGDVQVIPGTASAPNAQGVYSAKIRVADPRNPGQFFCRKQTMAAYQHSSLIHGPLIE